MSVMAGRRITGRRPLRKPAEENLSDDNDGVQFVPSPKKIVCKKFRRKRNVKIESPVICLDKCKVVSPGKSSANNNTTRSFDPITVTDDSGDEYVDCVSDLNPNTTKSSSKKQPIHVIPSTSSDEGTISEDIFEISSKRKSKTFTVDTEKRKPLNKKQIIKRDSPENQNKAQKSLSQSPELTEDQPKNENKKLQISKTKNDSASSSSSDKSVSTESKFMRTFKALRDSFKEKEEDDLIVVSKVHPDVAITSQDINGVVKNIVANVGLNGKQKVQNLTSYEVAQRMKNLYQKDFSSRMNDISRSLLLAKLHYDEKDTDCEEIRPGLKSHDLDTLQPGEWLNDVIINKYLELLVRASSTACLLSSFFYEELCRNVNPNLPVGWLSKDYMLIPVCIRSHWSLLCAEVKACTLCIYNSMEISHKEIECAAIILSYLRMKYSEETHLDVEWSLLQSKGLPQQVNAYDCGVYVCMYARLILFRLSSEFQPSHVTSFREWIRNELLSDQMVK